MGNERKRGWGGGQGLARAIPRAARCIARLEGELGENTQEKGSNVLSQLTNPPPGSTGRQKEKCIFVQPGKECVSERKGWPDRRLEGKRKLNFNKGYPNSMFKTKKRCPLRQTGEKGKVQGIGKGDRWGGRKKKTTERKKRGLQQEKNGSLFVRGNLRVIAQGKRG